MAAKANEDEGPRRSMISSFNSGGMVARLIVAAVGKMEEDEVFKGRKAVLMVDRLLGNRPLALFAFDGSR